MKLCQWCGGEVTGRRKRFCSDICMHAFHHRREGEGKRKKARDDERLTLSQVRMLNKEFEPIGLRICRVCQGHPQPLDQEHFQWRVYGYFDTQCRVCKRKADVDYRRKHVADEVLAACHRKAVMDWYWLNREQRLPQMRNYKARQKRQRLAAVLAQNGV